MSRGRGERHRIELGFRGDRDGRGPLRRTPGRQKNKQEAALCEELQPELFGADNDDQLNQVEGRVERRGGEKGFVGLSDVLQVIQIDIVEDQSAEQGSHSDRPEFLHRRDLIRSSHQEEIAKNESDENQRGKEQNEIDHRANGGD